MAGLEGLNLGNLAAALRLTGVDPSFLADEEDQQMPPMEPSLPQNPYANTEPTIEQMDFNRRAPQGQLAEQRMASQNRALDLVGERQAVQEGAFDRQAGAARTMLDRRESGYQKAEDRVDMNTARTDDFRRQADEQLQAIIAKAKAPPEQKGQVLQIIASVLAASGKPGASAIGAGMSALAGSMQQSTQQWLAQLQAEDAAYRDTLAAAQDGRADSESYVRVQKELADLSYGVYGAALEEIKATAGSQDARLIAAEMQNNLRKGYVEEQMNINAGAQRARSGGMKQRQLDMLNNMKLADLETLVNNGEGGELARKVLTKRKLDELAIADKAVGVALKEGKLSGAGGPAEPGTEGERKVDSVVQGIAGENGPYRRLTRLVASGGGDPGKIDMPRWGVSGPSRVVPEWMTPADSLQTDADINALIGAVLRAESGASITESEMVNKRRSLGLDSTDERVRAKGLLTLMNQAKGIDKFGRLGSSGAGGIRERPMGGP